MHYNPSHMIDFFKYWKIVTVSIKILSSTTVFRINNNKKKYSWSQNQHIRMISKGSSDTEDWSNKCWIFNFASHLINILKLKTVILNCNEIVFTVFWLNKCSFGDYNRLLSTLMFKIGVSFFWWIVYSPGMRSGMQNVIGSDFLETDFQWITNWALALVLAGHVSQACISWFSANHIYLLEYDTYRGIPM